MPTPDSPISLLDIQNEFGGSNPISIDEYYAGLSNGYVPAGTPGIPTSGPISLNDFRNKSKSLPLNISVTPSSRPEGQSFTVTVTDPSNINRPTIYWGLTDYTNLDNSDFVSFQGSINYSSGYPNFTVTPSTDSSIEGTGTFKITFYSDAARTLQIGQSSLLTVTDSYSLGTMTRSNTQIYRYSNLNIGLMSSTITQPSSGLVGSTVYWEVYGDSGVTINNSDLTSLTGTLTVPANGNIQATITAVLWDGQIDITTNKNIYIRFRFNNSSGAEISNSLSLPIVLTRKPVLSFSFDPDTIREGFATTRNIALLHVPYGSTSLFYTLNQFGSDTGTAADIYGFSSTGEIPISSNNVQDVLYAALDTNFSESTESISHVLRLNSTVGTGVFAATLNIQSPAILNQSPNLITTTRSSFRISTISAYPIARAFTAKVRHSGSTTWYTGTFNVSAMGISSEEWIPIPNITAGTAANHTLEFQIENDNYQTFNTTTTESYIWPVSDVTLSIVGGTASGVSTQLNVSVTSWYYYATARTYDIQYRIKASGQSWPSDPESGWTSFGVSYTIPANIQTNTSSITVFSRNAVLFGDVQVRCVLSGHEHKISNSLIGVWF